MTGEDKLDRLLAQHFQDSAASDDGDAAARVLAALAAPLPAQRRSWRRWPALLLDWDFAPAWPRVAAMAGCAALGFAIGVVGQSIDPDVPRGDFQLAALLSEPEPISGVLP
jgi:hypothetical protein